VLNIALSQDPFDEPLPHGAGELIYRVSLPRGEKYVIPNRGYGTEVHYASLPVQREDLQRTIDIEVVLLTIAGKIEQKISEVHLPFTEVLSGVRVEEYYKNNLPSVTLLVPFTIERRQGKGQVAQKHAIELHFGLEFGIELRSVALDEIALPIAAKLQKLTKRYVMNEDAITKELLAPFSDYVKYSVREGIISKQKSRGCHFCTTGDTQAALPCTLI
jgi:hypothetical protein